MYVLIIILPFLGFLSASLFGRLLGSKGASIVTTSCLAFSVLISFQAFCEVALVGCSTYIKLISWIDSETLNIDWGFMFDTLTVVMCCVITFVSLLVHFYSTEYMSHDPHVPRFMSYLSLFTFFMLVLVTADNFVQMFVGWEGVGLCSFLLINFWFTRIQANKAAIKAMILNRIGDFGLVIGILVIFVHYRSVDYCTVFALTPLMQFKTINFLNCEIEILTVVGVFLFVGAVGKSAQLGLHTWLPDAMEGPTPVSALIHAATMVTAGVFLIARCSPLYEYSTHVLEIITIVGASTAFFAATVGLVQNDLKKVIAYSTCSQLGYMIFACGLSNYSIGVFHLVNHAFFKALLFLGAGSVIHAVFDEQDMRKMGGLKNLVPFTYSVMVTGSLALIGFPFLTGFYSKDLILEVAYGNFTPSSHYSYVLGTLGAFLTAFYSTRLLYLTFLSSPNGFKSVIVYAQDSSYQICISLGLLCVPSIFIGFLTKDMFVGLGTDFWGSSIFVAPENMSQIDAEFIPQVYKLLPVFLSLLGASLSFLFYSLGTKVMYQLSKILLFKKIYNFLNKKWFFDKVYNENLGQLFFEFGYSVTYKELDKGIFEAMGPKGLSILVKKFSNFFTSMESGYLYHYSFSMLLAILYILLANSLLGLEFSYKYLLLFIFPSIIWQYYKK